MRDGTPGAETAQIGRRCASRLQRSQWDLHRPPCLDRWYIVHLLADPRGCRASNRRLGWTGHHGTAIYHRATSTFHYDRGRTLAGAGAWVSQLAKNITRTVGHDQSHLQPSLIELFHHQNLFLDGAFSLEQGFIYTATIWSAMVYYIVERRFRLAAIWSALASMLSLVGMMHAWKFANGDTALNSPLLD